MKSKILLWPCHNFKDNDNGTIRYKEINYIIQLGQKYIVGPKYTDCIVISSCDQDLVSKRRSFTSYTIKDWTKSSHRCRTCKHGLKAAIGKCYIKNKFESLRLSS